MPLVYEQATGRMLLYAEVLGTGYSGRGIGLNNPLLQDTANVGPIPVGFYVLQPPRESARLGQFVLALIPFTDNKMFGRAGFDWHGDEVENPGQRLASDGCIIHAREVRETGWNSGQSIVQVVTGLPQ
jgi:Protein of unknown function (DUF2778)